MSIWAFYCSSQARAGYKFLLTAQGYKVSEAEEIMRKFAVYVDRAKNAGLDKRLSMVDDFEEFSNTLEHIFNHLWRDYISDNYKSIPSHFMEYLEFIPLREALTGEYLSDERKHLVDDANVPYPAIELTEMENRYVKNGVLKAMVNPHLIAMIRNKLDNGGTKKEAVTICKLYYRIVLPKMTAADCKVLIDSCWGNNKKARNGTGIKRILLTFPDGRVEKLSTLEAMKEIIRGYGEKNVAAKRLEIRGYPVVTNKMPFRAEKIYQDMGNGFFININGGSTDRRNAINTINCLFGKKFKAELV